MVSDVMYWYLYCVLILDYASILTYFVMCGVSNTLMFTYHCDKMHYLKKKNISSNYIPSKECLQNRLTSLFYHINENAQNTKTK